jgi:anti-sigma-K factor RskA
VIEDRFEELLGPYLLGELSAEEELDLERHLEGCSRCRDELARAREAHDLLRELAAGGPPPELKARVLARARGETPIRSGVGRRLWVPVAAALALVAILSIWLLRPIIGATSAEVALTPTNLAPGASGELRGEKVGGNFQVELEVRGLPRLRKDEYYEMWYAKEDEGRISCGTFRAKPKGQTTVNLMAPANAVSYPKIEVTREPDDGDPGSSGEEVLVGDLRSL